MWLKKGNLTARVKGEGEWGLSRNLPGPGSDPADDKGPRHLVKCAGDLLEGVSGLQILEIQA